MELPRTLCANGKDYAISRFLGKGKGGYSWLASDNDSTVVVKQIHHEPCAYYQFGNKIESEIRDYEQLREVGIRMPRLLDVDVVNELIVKEYIDGPTIFDLVKKNSMEASYLDQVQTMCHQLYPANLNIDYFPTNFVVNNGFLYYVDYECNEYMDKWNFENWGRRYWSQTEEFLEYLAQHSE